MGGGGGGGGGRGVGMTTLKFAALQTTLLRIKRLNITTSAIFIVLCVLCFQRHPFQNFILIILCECPD